MNRGTTDLSDVNLKGSPKVWYGKTRIPVDLVYSSISRGFHPVSCYVFAWQSASRHTAKHISTFLDLDDEEGKGERLFCCGVKTA